MAKPSFETANGKGPFDGVASPLNVQVPKSDPRSDVAKNQPFGTQMPEDKLGILP